MNVDAAKTLADVESPFLFMHWAADGCISYLLALLDIRDRILEGRTEYNKDLFKELGIEGINISAQFRTAIVRICVMLSSAAMFNHSTRSELTRVAGSIVEVSGVLATSAHEAAGCLATIALDGILEAVCGNIDDMTLEEVLDGTKGRISEEQLKVIEDLWETTGHKRAYLYSYILRFKVTEDNLKTACKALKFLDTRPISKLAADIRREYILATGDVLGTDSNPGWVLDSNSDESQLPDPSELAGVERISGSKADIDTMRPVWNRELGKLSFSGEVVKKIRSTTIAKNVTRVLDAFEEDGWPDRIDDPLDPSKDQQRLHETIKRLNDNLTRLRFRADGTGQGIIWEIA